MAVCVWERERKRGRRERRGEEEIAGAAGDKFPRNKPAPAKENKVSTRTRILALAPFRSQHRRVACPTGLRSCTRGNSPNESYPRRGNSSFFFRRLSVSCKARSKKIGLRNFSKGEIFVEIELERLWKCWKFFNAWSKNGLECKFWKRLNDSKRRIVFNPLCPFRRIINPVTQWFQRIRNFSGRPLSFTLDKRGCGTEMVSTDEFSGTFLLRAENSAGFN